MKIHHLNALIAVVKHNFSISSASDGLSLTQPAISKQIQQFEAELNLSLFIRNGKRLVGLTDSGQEVYRRALEVINKIDDIYQFSYQRVGNQGSLSVATTHTQARYVLPRVINRFRVIYPDVKLAVHQGSPKEVAELALKGEVDLAIATEAVGEENGLVTLPCYQWNRCVVTPHEHSLTRQNQLNLAQLCDFPIITYGLGYTGRRRIDEAFEQAGLVSNIVLTAVDSDVIKTYVRLGMGVGIIANMAYSDEEDRDLVATDARGLFGTSYSHVAIRKDKYIRPFIFSFIEMLAPHLTEDIVIKALRESDFIDRKQLLKSITLPSY